MISESDQKLACPPKTKIEDRATVSRNPTKIQPYSRTSEGMLHALYKSYNIVFIDGVHTVSDRGMESE